MSGQFFINRCESPYLMQSLKYSQNLSSIRLDWQVVCSSCNHADLLHENRKAGCHHRCSISELALYSRLKVWLNPYLSFPFVRCRWALCKLLPQEKSPACNIRKKACNIEVTLWGACIDIFVRVAIIVYTKLLKYETAFTYKKEIFNVAFWPEDVLSFIGLPGF